MTDAAAAQDMADAAACTLYTIQALAPELYHLAEHLGELADWAREHQLDVDDAALYNIGGAISAVVHCGAELVRDIAQTLPLPGLEFSDD
jgi:hypothetical protein